MLRNLFEDSLDPILYTFLFTRVLGVGAEIQWRFREKGNQTDSEVFNKIPENGCFLFVLSFGSNWFLIQSKLSRLLLFLFLFNNFLDNVFPSNLLNPKPTLC